MGKTHKVIETGSVIARAPDPSSAETITAAVTLPVSLWERVTNWINDLHHWEGEERPDIPLDLRIAEFLDLQTQIWAHDVREADKDLFDTDLDDDVPF